MAALSFVLHHVGFLGILTATAYVAGRAASRGLVGQEEGKSERFAIAMSLGLALLAHLLFCLGLVGFLRPVPVLLVLAAVHLLGWRAWRELVAGWSWKGRRAVVLSALGILALVPVFALSLYPPTGFDETLYHLPYAKAFAATGGLPFLPELRNPVFPQLNDVLFAGALLLSGDVAAHLVQLLMTLATAALLVAWGERLGAPRAGWIAAGLYLGNPIVTHLAGTAYVEPGLVLFVTAALYALDRWREQPAPGWLALAAFFAASAAGTKYLGLFFVGLVVAGAAVLGFRERPARRWLRDVLWAAAVALLALAPSYGRILFYTGNPLFPFYPEVFGGSAWDPNPAASRALSTRLWDLAAFGWNVLFDREAVGRQPPYSPAYLLLLPVLAVAACRDVRVRRLLVPALAYAVVFLLIPPDARYALAVLPVVSLAAAVALSQPGSWRPGAREIQGLTALGLAAFLFLPGWLYAGYRIANQGPVPVTIEQRDRYLAARLPVYPAILHLNRTRGDDYTAYAFYAENMKYFAAGLLLGDWSGPANYTRIQTAAGDAESLIQALDGLGATHLIRRTGHPPALPESPAFDRHFRRIYADEAVEVYERVTR